MVAACIRFLRTYTEISYLLTILYNLATYYV